MTSSNSRQPRAVVLSRLRRRLLASVLATVPMVAFSASAVPAHAAPASFDARSLVAPAASFERLSTKAADTSTGTVRVIVGLQTKFDPAVAADASLVNDLRATLKTKRASLLAALSGTEHQVLRSFDSSPYVGLELTPEALRALKASGLVASVEEDKVVRESLATTTALIESKQQVSRGFDGSGRVVAVLDSGIDSSHPFFAGRIVEEACFIQTFCRNTDKSWVGPGSAEEINGDSHGTKVAGIAAGKRFGSVAFDGIAPGAQIMPIRISKNGGSTELDMIAALEHIRDRALAGVPVAAVNISMGAGINTSDCDSVAIKAPIDTLRAMGIPTIFSAGNAWDNAGVSFPACVSTAITVGATDVYTDPSQEQVASYSNSSSQVELLAPGTYIVTSEPGGGFTEQFGFGSAGTSFAAPVIAGAWASYLERYPGSSVTDVLATFRRTGKLITDPDNSVAVPRINLSAAMGGWGFVAVNTTNASSTPAAAQQGNSTGSTNTVTRSATGTYVVSFPKLGSALRGNATVQEKNTTTGNRCRRTSLGATGTTALVGVRCTTSAGALVDQQFNAAFQVDEAAHASRAGYVTSVDIGASHTPLMSLQANSTGGTNTVTRSAVGQYSVTFPGFGANNGVPVVTPGLTTTNSCQVVSWNTTSAQVACFDSAGVASDTQFSLAIKSESSFAGTRGALIYANSPSTTPTYTPSANFTWNSQGATNSSTRIGPGEYLVALGTMPATGLPAVTGYGASAVICNPQSWFASGASTYVTVRCTTPAGTAIDSRFTLSYGTSTPA